MRFSFRLCIVALSCVDLIQGASQAFVLSDVGTDAAGRAGKLRGILAGSDANDRDPPRAMRPRLECLERKSFSLAFIFGSAELFTEDCGKLRVAFLALG